MRRGFSIQAPGTGRVPGAEAVRTWLTNLTATSPELSDPERVEALRELEELKAQAAAVQARLAFDLDASQRQQHADAGIPAAQQGRGAAAQIGLARRESPQRAASLLGLAKVLIPEMPHTYAALDSGDLSEWRAKLLARETACLSREDRGIVDAILCKDPSRLEGWGDRRLVAEAAGWPSGSTRKPVSIGRAVRPPIGGSRSDPPRTR